MSTRSDTSGKGRGRQVPVAEYVLGVLDAEEHARVAALIAQSPELQRELRFWRMHFSQLDDGFEPVAPPAGAYAKVEQRLFGTTAAAGWGLWHSLAVWRGIAAAALAVAIVAAGLLAWQPGRNAPQVSQPQFVASLEAEGGKLKFVAVYDAATGRLRVTSLAGDPVSGRDFELWFIEGKNAPISLGPVVLGKPVEVMFDPGLQARMGAGIVLAVTVEPKGGAPEGKPTGPVVAAGTVAAI